MKSILAARHRGALDAYRRRDSLLAFDYDGTLAPIVAEPDRAEMREGTRERLRRLAALYPVAILSGRARLDAQRFLHGVPVLEVVGNHGSETYGAEPGSQIARVARWREALAPVLARLPGSVIEDKRYSLSLHYRRCADPRAEALLRDAAGALAGVRLIGGKQVLNLVPDGAPDKGSALQRLCARHGRPRALFVGDDETDEAVFRHRGAVPVLGIRVGPCTASAAPYGLPGQADIDRLLDLLLDGAGARTGGYTGAPAGPRSRRRRTAGTSGRIDQSEGNE